MAWIWNHWQVALARRPSRYGTVLTLGFVVLCATAFVLVDSVVDRYLMSDAESLVDRLEWESALPFLAVSALLFFAFSHALLKRLEERTRALHLSRSERMLAEQRALLGMLSSTVLHDCNNALHVVMGNLCLLEARDQNLDEDSRRFLAQIDASLQHIQQSVALVRDFSTHTTRIHPLSLKAVAQDCATIMRRHPACIDCTIRVDSQGDAVIRGDRTRLRNAIVNLVLNAAEASGVGGRVRVLVRDAGPEAVIEVHDNGPGIAQHAAPKVLEAGFTTKEGGSGLGLYSASECARLHRGSVQIGPSPLGGACISLILQDISAADLAPDA